MSPTSLSAVERLAVADVLLFCARVFSPPTGSSRHGLDVGTAALGVLLGRLGHEGTAWAARVASAVEAARRQGPEGVRMEYGRLFEAGGRCGSHEASYVRRDKGAILGDVAGFCAAFGLRIDEETRERIDHIACELELGGMLLALGVCASLEGRGEDAAAAGAALDDFLEEHLGEWALPFAEQVASTTTLPLYREAAGLLAWSLEHLARRTGGTWLARAPSQPVAADDEDDESCGP